MIAPRKPLVIYNRPHETAMMRPGMLIGSPPASLVDAVEWDNADRGQNPIFWAGEKDPTSATTLGYLFPFGFPVITVPISSTVFVQFFEGRQRVLGATRGDWSCADILTRYTTNKGRTWSALKSCLHEGSFALPANDGTSASGVFINLFGAGYHVPSGTLILLATRHYTKNADTAFRALIGFKSTDYGQTLTKLDGTALSGALQGTDITEQSAANSCIIVGTAQPAGHGKTFIAGTYVPANLTGSISAVTTSGGLVRCTSASHGLQGTAPTGSAPNVTADYRMKVRITGGTNYDGDWPVQRVDANNFDLVGSGAITSPTGLGSWAAMTRWFAGRPSVGVMSGDHLIFAAHMRWTADINDGAVPLFISTPDGGTTWTIRGMPDPSNAANAEKIEPTLIKRSDGTLYAAMRHRVSPANVKYYTASSDDGATWSNAAAITGINGPESPCGLVVMGSRIIAAFPDHPNNTDRFRVAVAVSTDGGLTFGAVRHLAYDWFGYPSCFKIDNNTFGISYSAGNQSRDKILGAGTVKFGQEIRCIRVDLPWMLRTTNADNYSRFEFTEAGLTALGGGVSGKRVLPGGSIPDWGPQRQVIIGTADTDASPSNVYPTYSNAIGATLETGVIMTSTAPLLIAEADLHHGFTPEANESFVWVWRGLFNFGGNAAVIFANREAAAGSVGIAIRHRTDGKVEAAISDGGADNTVISTTVVTSSTVLHTVAVERDIAAAKLRIYVNTTTAEHEVDLTETGSLRSAAVDFVANRYPGGTLAVNGHAVVLFEVHRSAKIASGTYTMPTATNPPKSLPGRAQLSYTNPFDNKIRTLAPYTQTNDGANLKLGINAVWDRGYHVRAGGSIDGSGRPPKAFVGLNPHACWDQSPNGWYVRGNHGSGSLQTIRYIEDTISGTPWPAWQHVRLSGSGTSFWQVYRSIGSDLGCLDFIHKTGIFSIVMALKITTGGATQAVMANARLFNGNSDPGMILGFGASNQIDFRVRSASTITWNNNTTQWEPDLFNLTVNVWYFLAIVCNGSGAGVFPSCYLLAIDPAATTRAAKIGTAKVSTTAFNPGAAANSAFDFYIGGEAMLDQYKFDGALRGPYITDIALGEAALEAFWDFFLAEPNALA